ERGRGGRPQDGGGGAIPRPVRGHYQTGRVAVRAMVRGRGREEDETCRGIRGVRIWPNAQPRRDSKTVPVLPGKKLSGQESSGGCRHPPYRTNRAAVFAFRRPTGRSLSLGANLRGVQLFPVFGVGD